jgi:hypothetical protein
MLHIPLSLGLLQAGDSILLHGRSLIDSLGYIEVDEIHINDAIGPILRSIPGIIGFVVLFFLIFKIRFQKLAFVPRSESYA